MKTIAEMVMRYRSMEETVPNSGMLREVRWQYEEMSNGGDGGPSDASKSIRDDYYPGAPDSYFQEICDLLGWPR